MKHFLLKTVLLLFALVVGSSAWGTDYEELFTITSASVVTNSSYAAYNTTVSSRNFVITYGGNNKSVGTNSGNRSNCNLSSYSKYAVSPVTTSSTASAFACTTSISDVSKISYTFSGGSNQTNTNVYLLYSEDNTTFSQVSLTSGTQGATISSGTQYVFSAKTGYFALLFEATNSSGNWRIDDVSITFYKEKAPDYTITAQSNNNSYGTVSLSGTTITATPAEGYRVVAGNGGYTVTSGTATVTNNGDNTFSVTPTSDCTVQINFEAIPTYTVTFDEEGGSCSTSSLTESVGGGGVTLPTATISVAGWEFVGWAESTIANTNTQPTLYKAGSTYHPISATTLHAVYTLSETGTTYTRVTSISQLSSAKKIAIVSKKSTSRILNHDATTVTAPTETAGEITVSSDQMFALSGDNTTGYVFTGTNGTLSQETLSASGSGNNDKAIDWTGINNRWIIETNTNTDNVFAVRNAASEYVALEFDSGWKTYYVFSYTSSEYTAMKLYVPKTAYNSNPSAIVTPTVSFGSSDPVTLYLDGTTSNTKTATVTGVSKTINYSSSNTSVATVTSAGVVTAVGIGTATITASVDAELGVSASASDTYTVTVKSATTLAGIKAVATSSTATNFTADLASDLVITYVNGSHAYLQSGDVAVYASCATEGWTAGKKFTGAISGQVKKLNNEYQITAIDQTPVAGGVVPDAIEVAITNLTTANYATYEGRKIAINGATISTAMTSSQNSGGKITTDGTNTLNIYSREKGITLTKDEKGNFIGYIGRYNDGIRYYMYEQSQFTKTHNVPQNQVMAFENASYNLDEETDVVTSFAGQTVTKTTVKGTVTYSIKDGSDAIITSLDSSTGAVVLNGSRGTATIVATAAAAEETDGDVITPYKELSKEYTITVRPRYTVTFSVDGDETVLREASFGAGVTVPANPSDIDSYKFQGWKDAEVVTTDTKPDFASITAGATYNPSGNQKYYAVFAREDVNPNAEQTSKFTFKGSSVSSPYVNKEATWTFTAVTFATTNNAGLCSQSITVTPSANVTSITSVTVTKTGNTWAKAATLTIADGSDNNLATIHGGSDNSDFSNNNEYNQNLTSNQSSSYTFTSSGNAWIESITLTYTAPQITAVGYTTTVSKTKVTLGLNGFTTFASPYALDLTEANLQSQGVVAYKAVAKDGMDIVFRSIDQTVLANTGILLKGTAGTTVEIDVVASGDAVDGNIFEVNIAGTTFNPESDYYYFGMKKATSASDDLTFALFDPDQVAIPATKAYFKLSTSLFDPSVKTLNARFEDGESTGITEVQGANGNVEGAYDMMGRKVAQPTRGLYIVNGKKVFINK